MINISNIHKNFIRKGHKTTVLNGISFDIPQGSFTTIFGPNGCGKSTLVNIIGGLDRPELGSVNGIREINGSIGYVFQDYRRSLLPWYSVEQNILFPLKIRGVSSVEKKDRLEEVLTMTGVKLDLRQKVFSLSGGQAQAVCILRALIIQPNLLILDEPFAALDYERTVVLRQVISNVSRTLKLTVLFISHDLEEAIALGDQVVFLSKAPTTVAEILPVNLPYPRCLETTTSNDFLILKQRAVEIFRRCVDNDQED